MPSLSPYFDIDNLGVRIPPWVDEIYAGYDVIASVVDKIHHSTSNIPS
jgi:hypothetical protein